MKDTVFAKVLLEKDGVLVNRVEVKDPTTGSRYKITLTSERVIVKVIKDGPLEKPSFEYRILLPGENRLESAGGVRLLLVLPYGYSSYNVSIPFLVTYSLRINISIAFANMIGDLSEEFAELRLKRGALRARVWHFRQIITSACPIIYVVIKQVLTSRKVKWMP